MILTFCRCSLVSSVPIRVLVGRSVRGVNSSLTILLSLLARVLFLLSSSPKSIELFFLLIVYGAHHANFYRAELLHNAP